MSRTATHISQRSLSSRAAKWFFLLFIVAPSAHAQRYPAASFDPRAESELVQLTNQERARRGLQPLKVDKRLTEAARTHTELMVQHRALSHQFSGEPPLQDRVAAENFPSDRLAENVDLDVETASAHQALMHSPPHRRNILDPDYNTIGIGVIRYGENIYVTEDFGRRLPEMSEPQAEAAVQSAIASYARAHHFAPPASRRQPQLRRMACDMARNDSVRSNSAATLPGVHSVFTWTASDPAILPKGMDRLLSSSEGYALGACFAPSVSHPGGIYWVVMVGY